MRQGRINLAITFDLRLDFSLARIALPDVVLDADHSSDHPFATRQIITLGDIASELIILFEETLSNRHTLQLFRNQGLSPTVAHRVRSLEIMRSLAAYREGVGISYGCPPTDRSYDGAMVHAIPITDRSAREAIILARAVDAPTSSVVKAATAAIAAMFTDRKSSSDSAF